MLVGLLPGVTALRSLRAASSKTAGGSTPAWTMTQAPGMHALRTKISSNGWGSSDESLHRLVPEVWAAADRLVGSGVLMTPLLPSPWLLAAADSALPAAALPAAAYLKLENRQATGAFKARGAVNKLASLSDEDLGRGATTASSGNHALAVLFACQALERQGRAAVAPSIFLPTCAAPHKLEALRAAGAQVQQYGADAVEAEREAQRSAEERGLPYISPYDDLQVAGGQGTIALELLAEIPASARLTLFIPVGGGGLISGIAALAKSVSGEIRVVGCQPAASDVMRQSVAAGRILDVPSDDTLSDGSAGGVDEGSLTFEPCTLFVDEWVTVSEPEIARGMISVLEAEGERIEDEGLWRTCCTGSAGVAVAAYVKQRDAGSLAGRTCVIVCCGGNVSDATLDRARLLLNTGT